MGYLNAIPDEVFQDIIYLLPISERVGFLLTSWHYRNILLDNFSKMDEIICSRFRNGNIKLIKVTPYLSQLCSSNLAKIDFTGMNNFINDDYLNQLLQNLRGKVRPLSLSLDYCCQLTTNGLLKALKGFPLAKLSLRSCALEQNTPAMASALSFSRETLQEFDFSWSQAIDARIIIGFPNLRKLTCVGCGLVEDGIVAEIMSTCPKLTEINIAYCPISNAGLGYIFNHGKNLKSLTLSSPSSNVWVDGNWTQNGLRALSTVRSDVNVHLGTSTT